MGCCPMNTLSDLEARRAERVLLEKAGRALYGINWKEPISRDLAVEVRAIRRWVDNQNRIPPGIWAKLAQLLHEREGVLMDARHQLTRRILNVRPI